MPTALLNQLNVAQADIDTLALQKRLAEAEWHKATLEHQNRMREITHMMGRANAAVSEVRAAIQEAMKIDIAEHSYDRLSGQLSKI